MKKGNEISGHLASGAAYAIFGLNIVFCKNIANATVITPTALFGIRMVIACAMFWALSLFLPKEKVSKKDLLLTAAASFIGLVVPQYTFLSAITITSSIETSIMSALTPIFTMFIAAIFLKEPVTWKKAAGVALSFTGVTLLIFNSIAISSNGSDSNPAGIALLLLNSISFAAYLGIFRPLIRKYSVVTFMKWMFLFSAIPAVPFSAHSIISTDFNALTPQLLSEIGFLVIFATFIAYFLIPFGQKRLRPTLVSMYTYLQPILAVLISLITGLDTVSWQKTAAIILVFGGVAIVNRSRAASTSENH